MTYTEKELNQFLHGISMSLLSKKSAQHWRYDEETAKEIEWLEALERKVRADKADRKTENSSEKPNNCDTCRNKGFEGCEQPCLGCGCCGLYEPKDEPTTQTETQNSNLTFEKDECAKEYEELGLKELKELIKADRKTEPTISKMEQVDEPQTDCPWK